MNQCPICCEEFNDVYDSLEKDDSESNASDEEEENNNIVETGCGHLFHKECLSKWYRKGTSNNSKCPTCRQEIEIKSYLKF